MGFRFYKKEHIEIVHINNETVRFDRHTHSSDYICSIMIKGCITFKTDDFEKMVYEGSYFTVEPNQAHSIISEQPISLLSLCIKKNFVYSLKYDEKRELIDTTIRDICSGLVSDKFLDTLAYGICSLKKSVEKNNINNETMFDELLFPYELTENITLSKLSEKYYVSKFHFIREFEKRSGLTPHRYILQCRIRKSQQLLQEGISVADAACMTDFYDQSHFVKVFKKVVGVTPSEYKASFRNILQAN